MKTFKNLYHRIYDLENLHAALHICLRGKRYDRAALDFTYHLSEQMYELQHALKNQTYHVSDYFGFYINYPKKRWIEALPFQDRVIQQALCQVIQPLFVSSFIYDTYACLKNKGTHAGSDRLQKFMISAGKKYRKVWCLKADISSYFPSIDHQILKKLFYKKIRCRPTLDLIFHIIDSNKKRTGIPIGNLLSQLSANIYLDEFDHYIKESESVAYYVRYMDDFCILHEDKGYLKELKEAIGRYLFERRILHLNPKTSVFPLGQGVDFLGYRTWTDHKLLRRRSVKRMRKKLKVMVCKYHEGIIPKIKIDRTIKSWVAHALHADTYRIRKKILNTVRLSVAP